MMLTLIFLAAAVGQNVALITRPAVDCGTNPYDIHFLLDSSSRVGYTNFQKQLKFVNDFIEPFTIGPSDTQFGLTTFSSDTHSQFCLNSYDNKAELQKAVSAVNYDSGTSCTHPALMYVKRNAFDPRNGGRLGVPSILIIISDGNSDYPGLTLQAAERLKGCGITVLTVGVGPSNSVNETELRAIATDSSRYFHVDGYDALNQILAPLRKKSCQVCSFWKDTNAVFIEGKCLRFFSDALTYDQAADKCKAESKTGNVQLLTVTSDVVLDYVRQDTSAAGERSWVGASDRAVEGTWRWTDGTLARIQPSWWGENQPDNNNNEDCLIMRPDRKINDYGCGFQVAYFCEALEY